MLHRGQEREGLRKSHWMWQPEAIGDFWQSFQLSCEDGVRWKGSISGWVVRKWRHNWGLPFRSLAVRKEGCSGWRGLQWRETFLHAPDLWRKALKRENKKYGRDGDHTMEPPHGDRKSFILLRNPATWLGHTSLRNLVRNVLLRKTLGEFTEILVNRNA